jgi:hypothetical protein
MLTSDIACDALSNDQFAEAVKELELRAIRFTPAT